MIDGRNEMIIGIILCIVLLVILGINYVVFNKDYAAPSVIFCAVFFVSAVNCTVNLVKWETDISFKTLFVVLLGVLSFSIFSMLMHTRRFSIKWSQKKNFFNLETEPVYYKCSKSFCIFWLMLQVIVSMLIIQQVVNLTAMFGTNGSIASSISMYQYLDKFTTLDLRFPTVLAYIFIFTSTSGYVWGYILAYNLCYFKKIDILILLNFIMSCVTGMLTGSRGNSLQMFLAVIVMFLIFFQRNVKSTSKKFKTLLKIIIILAILLLTFEATAGLMGRDNSLYISDYLSVYVGAPIKNLDLFLEEGREIEKHWGSDTFQTQFEWLGTKLGWNINRRAINVEMTYINGYNLGNVYTTFKDFYNDFSYCGVVICTGIMATILQYLYDRLKNKKLTQGSKMKLHLDLMIYAYLLVAMAFSFFSNKFYESFTITFIEKVFFWWLLSKILYSQRKVNFKFKK